MGVDLSLYIQQLRRVPIVGKYHARVLQIIQDSINNLATNVAASPNGHLPAPPTINQLNIKTDGNGMVHGTIDDNNEIQRGIHYFVEYQTTDEVKKGFLQPHIVHMGTSRTMHPFFLPAMDDDGKPQSYIVRAYSQYPGGKAGAKVAFGGQTPTLVAPGGTTKMTLLASTGSRTAQPTGQVSGVGFGDVLVRPQSNPKAAVKE